MSDGDDLDPTVLFRFAFSLWVTVVLTGCSYMAMGIELRCRGVLVKWWSFSFNPRKRIETLTTVIKSYRTFKRKREELPVFLWLMELFVVGIVVVPVAALVVFLVG